MVAELLRRVGLSPKEVACLGPFVHVTFLGDEPARQAMRVLSKGGAFAQLKVTENVVTNVGEPGGYGSRRHSEYTAHLKLAE